MILARTVTSVLLVLVLGGECVSAQEPGIDRKATLVLRAAEELIEDKQVGQAVVALQALLDQAENTKSEVTRTGPDGKPMQAIVSTWTEAERIIQSLPPDGMQFYQSRYSLVAAELLNRVKAGKEGDELLVEIVRRFRCTTSGLKATELLANQLLDAGKPKEAVPYFDRVLVWPGAAKLEPLTLYRAALALRLAGDKARAEEVWKQLVQRIGEGEELEVGDRVLRVNELRKEWEQGTLFPPQEPYGSPRYYLAEAEKRIANRAWESAFRILQRLLNQDFDEKVEVTRAGPDGKPMKVIVSLWAETERIIQSLPPAGLQAYEENSSPAENDPNVTKLIKRFQELDETVQRYRFTKSGMEATDLLANQLLAAGKPKAALQYFDRLLAWPGAAKLEPLTLYRAALTLRRAGDKPRSEEVWKQLAPRVGKEGLRVSDRALSLEELRKEWEKAALFSANEPETDLSAHRVLRVARRLLEGEKREQALRALQSLLDLELDTKVEVTRTGPADDDEPMRVVVGTKSEVEWIIQSLPPEGLQFYQSLYSPVAAELLNRAKPGKEGDDLLAEIVRRFRFTRGGVEAADRLADKLLAAGKPKEAAPYFDKLLAWPGAAKLERLSLYRAALALRLAGDKPRSEEVWKQLAPRIGKKGIQIDARVLRLEELRKELEKAAP